MIMWMARGLLEPRCSPTQEVGSSPGKKDYVECIPVEQWVPVSTQSSEL
jgi:hypothetical protein